MFIKLVLAQGPEPGSKISVRLVELKGGAKLQWAERRGKQELHENLTLEESLGRLEREFPRRFGQFHLMTTEADLELRCGRDGRLQSRRGKPSSRKPIARSHDATRNYLIPEGQPCPFLEAVGVMTASGQVKASMQHKFRQINRFLEFVNDIYRDLPAEGPLHVVDFGCGKSYLTMAIHHLLTTIHGRTASMTGIDRMPDVVETCRLVASRLELSG